MPVIPHGVALQALLNILDKKYKEQFPGITTFEEALATLPRQADAHTPLPKGYEADVDPSIPPIMLPLTAKKGKHTGQVKTLKGKTVPVSRIQTNYADILKGLNDGSLKVEFACSREFKVIFPNFFCERDVKGAPETNQVYEDIDPAKKEEDRAAPYAYTAPAKPIPEEDFKVCGSFYMILARIWTIFISGERGATVAGEFDLKVDTHIQALIDGAKLPVRMRYMESADVSAVASGGAGCGGGASSNSSSSSSSSSAVEALAVCVAAVAVSEGGAASLARSSSSSDARSASPGPVTESKNATAVACSSSSTF